MTSNDAAPKTKKKIFFRKNFLIYPRFQLLLVGANFSIVSIGFLVVIWGVYHFFEQLHVRGVDSGLSSNHYYFIFLGSEAHSLYNLISGAYIVSILVTSGISLYFSQKIAGPIVRLNSYFKAMGEQKELPPLAFRKGDFFEELPAVINKALKR